MKSQERIVVVGGGYAGVLAAIRAARRTRGLAHVELVSESDAFVERIRLHEAAARGTTVRRSLAHLLAGTSVTLRKGTALHVDVGAARLEWSGGTLPYDRLVLATGTSIDRGRIPGADVFAKTLDGWDVDAVATAVRGAAARGGRVVVVGGGLTGVEAATEIAEAHPGLSVGLVTGHAVGERMSDASRDHVRWALRHLGVELHEHVRVGSIGARGVETSAGFLASDVTLLCAGFRAGPLAAKAGLPVDAGGRLEVDPWLRAVGAPRIYGAGDGARPLSDPGSPLPMGCKWAFPMAAHVADTLAAELRGRDVRPFDWRDVALCVSLGRRNGILQFMSAEGTPTSFAIKGRFAAFLKEAVCRFTVAALRLETKGIAYAWPHTRKRDALAAPRPELSP